MVEGVLTFLATAFALGTLWFWVLVIAIAAIISLEVHFDKGTSATVTLVGTVVFLHFFSGVNIFRFVLNNLGWFFGGAALYFLAGAGWSLVKLTIHTKNLDDKYRREQIEFIRGRQLPKDTDFKTLTSKQRKEWESCLNQALIDIDRNDGKVTFDLHKRRATVVMWIGHWPFSFLATMLNDPVRHIINFLYNRMFGLYERIIENNLGHTRGEVLTYVEVKDLQETEYRANQRR